MAYADVDKLSRKLRYIFKTYGVSGVISEKVNKALNDSTADVVEVKHGKWVDVYKGKYHNQLYVCSICGAKALYKFEVNELGNERAVQDLSLGCHHCRAKMDLKG